MHHKIAYKLKKKGWKKHHIAKTIHILKKAEDKKHPSVKVLDKILFWLVLFLIMLGNVIILIALLPVIIEMPQTITLIIFAIIGFAFGALIDNIIKDMELTRKHYFLAGVLIALMATLNMFLVITFARYVLKEVGVLIRINPLLTIFIYIIAFTLPHILFKIKEIKEFS